MDILEAVILGILQGATEFLPISSSGHLVLVPWWLGWDDPPLLFDVVVHLGTLVAVLAYFWRDWLTLLRAGWTALRTRSMKEPDARLLALLVLGTIPAALVGMLLEDYFESSLSEPPLVAGLLLVTAALLVLAERWHTGTKPLSEMTVRDAMTVGLMQALAILPGISRSGSTIAAGIGRGLSRPSAARFSFLLATPIIVGAGLKQTLDVLIGDEVVGSDMTLPLVLGFAAALIVGYGCIWFLMRLLQRRRLYGFAVYCAVFGTLSLLVALLS
ncbi:MAG: undecaprenyl-diphosphatase UppP [Chloroflexi bacterium]|nr:undecaprenyl-diphosphatase UppP [Chloroflexota bacterium]